MNVYTVDVGWTSQRPILPEQHTSRVTVAAHTGTDAEWLACAMVALRPPCVMATSSTVIDWEEGAP